MERSALAEIDRLRALRMLGFRSDRDIRVLATVAAEKGGIDAHIGVVRRARSGRSVGAGGVPVSADARALSSAPFSRLGVGPVAAPLRVADSLACARAALRFAVERPHRDHSSAAGCPERERQRHPATKRGGPPQAAAPSIWGE
ncbi:hypothetical protein FRAHR75_1330013 [Frankia sp. Hr75.2]|nr:hypothetical protein FRAHR75_1330013 [Frankia sp. Hr75.2]